MITDDERRDLAENIRNAANRRKDELQDDPDYSPFAALYAIFCGVRGFPRYKDLLHLADLIDRPRGRAFHTGCNGGRRVLPEMRRQNRRVRRAELLP
jgi:hypothetical protein